jgi:hypothetical protein
MSTQVKSQVKSQVKPQELFEALEMGKIVEVRVPEEEDDWFRWLGFNWDATFEYRIREPELVPHWPAVIKEEYSYWISDNLFASLEEAKERYEDYGSKAIRLATEYPAILLPPLPSEV